MSCCDICILSSVCVLTHRILELIIPLNICVTAEANLVTAITVKHFVRLVFVSVHLEVLCQG